jgi:ribosomal protein S12 methylthiotransferase
LYPTTITDDVLDAMAECDKVCKYIDLPLQHASADVLRRMRRPGNRDAYDRLLTRIRTRMPGVSLRTTFIVGFPGETEQDFQALLDFVRDTGFDHVGVFTYSHEEDTRAFALDDDVPADVKTARRDAVMALQQAIVRARLSRRIGEHVTVMVDGASAESNLVLTARLPGQAPDIDGLVYLDESDPSAFRPGDLVDAVITDSRGYDLVVRPRAAT